MHHIVCTQQHITFPAGIGLRQGAFGHIDQGPDRRLHLNMPIGLNDACRHQHALTNEIRHKTTRRTVVDGVRRIPLVQHPPLHHAHHIPHRKSFLLVVRDHQGRDASGFEDLSHIVGQTLTQFHVEIGKGFIEQQHIRARGQGARQRHALLLPT